MSFPCWIWHWARGTAVVGACTSVSARSSCSTASRQLPAWCSRRPSSANGRAAALSPSDGLFGSAFATPSLVMAARTRIDREAREIDFIFSRSDPTLYEPFFTANGIRSPQFEWPLWPRPRAWYVGLIARMAREPEELDSMNPVIRFVVTCALGVAVGGLGCSSSSKSNGNCGSTGGGGIGGGIGGGSASGSCPSSGSSSGGAGTCAAITATTACATCLAQQCCAEASACAADQACVTCDDGCDAAGNCAQCLAQNQAFNNLNTCGTNKCATACGGGGGGSCPAAATDTACDTCEKQSCCTQVVACQNDTACVNVAQSVSQNCGTSLSCAAQEAQQSGDAAAHALVTCLQNSCTTPCGG